MMTQATDIQSKNKLLWVRVAAATSYRAKSSAGLYMIVRNHAGGWFATFEVEGGVLRGIDALGGHVSRWRAERHPGVEEAKALAQAHHNARPYATVEEVTLLPATKHDYLVGDGATWSFGSDRHAGTVTRVTANSVWVRRDNARRTDSNGMSEEQEYRFIPSPDGDVLRFTFRADGRLRLAKCSSVLSHGRERFYDFTK